jgi:hypothetical protein
MSDPTPTDVPALVDRLRERQADFEMIARHGICVQSTPERLAGEYQEAADALTALRLDVQRITEERDAQVREAFMAARRARKWHGVWSFDERTGLAADIVDRDDAEAFAAYLRERQDGKEHAK